MSRLSNIVDKIIEYLLSLFRPEIETKKVSNTINNYTPKYMWCLDNGHGKYTKGKRSPKLEDGRQFFEYEFNREVVNIIVKHLIYLKIPFYKVVPEVKVDDALELRVSRANSLASKLPKIFVSIHSNAYGKTWSDPSGIETWYYNTSEVGLKFSKIFQRFLVKELGWRDRGIKTKDYRQFYVLKYTTMPAILTETGFFTNKEECKKLLETSYREKIALAHVKAIMEIEQHPEFKTYNNKINDNQIVVTV